MQVLLATFLVRADQVIPAARLLDELWESNPPRRADASLHVHISQLRKFLSGINKAEGEIITRPPGYMLSIGAAELDFGEFYRLMARSRKLLEDGSAEEAAAVMSDAIKLHRGPILGGLPAGPAVTNFAILLEESRLECFEILMQANLALGLHREVVGQLYSLTCEHPLREKFYHLLMVALYRCGRRADALFVYQRARATIAEALGVEPSRPLRDLHQVILVGDEKEWADGCDVGGAARHGNRRVGLWR
jgi:SARP family transcriptional regulator, regulator of embCAB operon